MLWSDVNAIYQIYPRSFFDASGDGIGDLKGITKKLGYIKGDPGALGIDAIWISPFFMSPMKDFGYDVSDYRDVDPIFGTLDDFDELLAEAHRRSIKVMIDYVPNHSSDQHEWFKEARSSHDNPKRDWYIWRNPKEDGSPPNNWQSVFGGSAWEYDEETGQYYLHSFLASQPDLNWANPEVQEAMADIIRFWMDRGVDGLRADAVRWMSKHPEFHDDPVNGYFRQGQENPYHELQHINSRYGPRLFEYLKVIADTVAEYKDRIVLFEDYIDDGAVDDRYEQYRKFYSVNPDVAAPFNMDGIHAHYNADALRNFVDGFQLAFGKHFRPYYCLGNHDQARLAGRAGFDQARLLGLMQLTLPGTPIVYYGEEIGMGNVDIPADKVRDPSELQVPGMGLGRDPGRTPMQWNDSEHAGFSNSEPWLPLADDYRSRNVASEASSGDSMLRLYQHLLGLRKSEILRSGEYRQWFSHHGQLFGYIREHAGEQILVILNVSEHELDWDDAPVGQVLASTHYSSAYINGRMQLAPHHGAVIYLDPRPE